MIKHMKYEKWNKNNIETVNINRYVLDTIIDIINKESTTNKRTYAVIIESDIDRKILNQPITVMTKIWLIRK